MKNNIFIIAEIAQAHDGSLGILHSYIDALAETGVDAVKVSNTYCCCRE
jgi:N,N'-diacetyllegionaminate synthase